VQSPTALVAFETKGKEGGFTRKQALTEREGRITKLLVATGKAIAEGSDKIASLEEREGGITNKPPRYKG
jgi:hypothetical protein